MSVPDSIFHQGLPEIVGINKRLQPKAQSASSTSKQNQNSTYIPPVLRNIPINIMILPLHTRLPNTNTPNMPRAHDAHRQTKYDAQNINQYERELGHQVRPFSIV